MPQHRTTLQYLVIVPLAALLLLGAPLATGQEEAPAEGPNIDNVLAELAKIGPEALIAHVKKLREDIDRLKQEAEAARQQAEQLEAQSAQTQKRVLTIEAFMASVGEAMAPPAEEAPAEEVPAEEAPAEEAPAEEAPAEEAPAAE